MMNGARALLRWLRRPSNEEEASIAHGVSVDAERERLRIHLEHQRALNRLRAEEREERMASIMGMFASVQANKQQRLGQVVDAEGER